MFPESFAFQLIVFLLGQVAAWCYLRTGRVHRGVALMIGGWVLADTALLARIAFDDARGLYLIALIGLQIYSLAELVLFCVGWWRHRSRLRDEDKREEHRAAFTDALRAYLRDDLETAESAFRGLIRRDPWDLQSSLALATVAARDGNQAMARRWFRAARSLDRRSAFEDVIDAELARWSPTSEAGVAAAADPAGPDEPKPESPKPSSPKSATKSRRGATASGSKPSSDSRRSSAGAKPTGSKRSEEGATTAGPPRPSPSKPTPPRPGASKASTAKPSASKSTPTTTKPGAAVPAQPPTENPSTAKARSSEAQSPEGAGQSKAVSRARTAATKPAADGQSAKSSSVSRSASTKPAGSRESDKGSGKTASKRVQTAGRPGAGSEKPDPAQSTGRSTKSGGQPRGPAKARTKRAGQGKKGGEQSGAAE